MNAEQIDTLLNFIQDTASGVDYFDFEARKAAAQLKADLAAMQTPITAEALTADGWKEEGARYVKMLGRYTGFVFGFRNSGGNIFWYVEPDGWGDTRFVEIVNDIPHMYDLRELVRLLGGAQ